MSEAMNEAEFDRLADEKLSALEQALDVLDEIELEFFDGKLILEFDEGPEYVINSHRAARQIWMAAERNAWHFDPKGDTWVASKPPHETLKQVLSNVLTKKLGRAISL